MACSFLWTIAKGISKGDIVLCPNGAGSYYVGEIMDDYSYHPEGIFPHRRAIRWYSKNIDRVQMGEALQKSAGSI